MEMNRVLTALTAIAEWLYLCDSFVESCGRRFNVNCSDYCLQTKCQPT